MSPGDIACVIPAFNAAPTLASVVDGLRTSLVDPLIIVIDDGSTDDTHAVATRVGDSTTRFPQNRGKGAALRAGLAIAECHGASAVLTIDADGQHDPRYAPQLVDSLAHADLAIGARDRTNGMPFGRRLTNRLSAAAVGRCIGRDVTDAQSGFRAMTRWVVSEIRPRGDRYEFETAFLIEAARRGARVAFVRIPTVYHTGVPSQFRAVRDSMRIVTTLWRFGMGASS